jgi:proteasome accessory factor C
VSGSDEGGALSTALAKLDRALGGEQLDVELDAPALLPLVQEAVAEGIRLTISYYSASTDRVSDREITPIRLFASEGHWYVDAQCSTAGDLRRFRVDRINAAEPVMVGSEPGPGDGADRTAAARTGSLDQVPPDGLEDSARRDLDPFVPGPDSRKVRISLDPATVWLVESILGAGPVEPVGDQVEIEVFVGGDAWLERLLLRLGPESRVVEPPEYRNLAAEAAARVLARYR